MAHCVCVLENRAAILWFIEPQPKHALLITPSMQSVIYAIHCELNTITSNGQWIRFHRTIQLVVTSLLLAPRSGDKCSQSYNNDNDDDNNDNDDNDDDVNDGNDDDIDDGNDDDNVHLLDSNSSHAAIGALFMPRVTLCTVTSCHE